MTQKTLYQPITFMPCLITPQPIIYYHLQITMESSISISKRMEQPHVPGTGSNYRTPVKPGTRQWKDQVSVPLLRQELKRHELLKSKDMFDGKQAKANQCKDIDMEDAPIVSSSDPDNWQDIVETETSLPGIYILTPPPDKQQYSRYIIPSQGLQIPRKHNLREDVTHQYDVWKKLIPTLVKPMLDFLSKISDKPSSVCLANVLWELSNRHSRAPTSSTPNPPLTAWPLD